MIVNYIEYDLVEKELNRYSAEIEHLERKELYLTRIKRVLDLCKKIKILKNKKIIIMLNKATYYGKENGKKKHKKYINFLKNMIKKNIKNTKIQHCELWGITDLDIESFSFGHRSKKYREKQQQKLILINKTRNPKYNHDILEIYMNGVIYSDLNDSENVCPVILTENMGDEYEYLEGCDIKYEGNDSIFEFECMFIEKN